eukprot:PITA_12320
MLLVTSLGGYLYYAIFVDDFSRKTWIYFLKKKDEVFKWFRSFKALVENQIGKKIKILRTDNGIEYESNEFKDYCRETDIKRETTTIYTLEQNGVAERKNRTIIEATQAILHDQGLPKFLWGESANTAVYVENRCPHQALDFKTPEEVFTKKRNKLDASGKKGTFVGYSKTLKTYRIYVPSQREVEVSHDVTSDEDSAFRKIRDLPIPRKENDDADAEKQDEPPFDELILDVEGLMDPIDPPPSEPSTSRKRPLWLKDTLEDAEKHIASRGTFRESKNPNRYQGYLAAMSTIVQSEPCTFEEAVKQQVWKDAMNKEYESIMENRV